MKRLEKKGYKVTRVIGTGNYVVTAPNGFSKTFTSIRQAINHYFGTNY